MKTVTVHLTSTVPKTFRTQKAADSVSLDISKKSEHRLEIKDIDVETDFKIGLIVGPSGAGKTTLAKELFGPDCFNTILDLEKPVIEQFPEHFSYDECVKYLNGIGLTQVPCWIRPAKTLSNGQRARAEAALQMASDREFVVIDEWTSVVDRTIAKVMSHCIAKFAKKNKKRIVLCSCHFDIIEWLDPDWVIDCAKAEFIDYRRSLRRKERKEKLEFTIQEAPSRTWKYFSKYHYLNENLPGGKIYCFGLFDGDRQIGFQCFANYTINDQNVYHSNRTVIHPDYCGFGLGMRLIDETTKYLRKTYGLRIRAKFSSIPLLKARMSNPNWKLIEVSNNLKKVKTLRAGERRAVKTYTFEYVGC